jgi:hypothetical protein
MGYGKQHCKMLSEKPAQMRAFLMGVRSAELPRASTHKDARGKRIQAVPE